MNIRYMNKLLQTTFAQHPGLSSHVEQLQVISTFCLILPEDGTCLRRGKTGNCIDAVACNALSLPLESKCPPPSGHLHSLTLAIRKKDCSNYTVWIAEFRATGEAEIIVVVAVVVTQMFLV